MTSNLLFVALLLALATVLANALPMEKSKDDKIVMTQERVDKINSMNLGFTVKLYPEFANLTWEQLRIRAGASKNMPDELASRKATKSRIFAGESEPPFDFRDKWPNCVNFTGGNTIQGNCASSWAISVARAIQYRECIKNGSTEPISAYDLLSCCANCQNNPEDICGEGGNHKEAAQFYIDEGVVTGGKYDSDEGCIQYKIRPKNNAPRVKNIKCKTRCDSGYKKHKYEDDKHRGSGKHIFSLNNQAVFNELKTFGPLVAKFDLYEDFPYYAGGVYNHPDDKTSTSSYYATIIGHGVDEKGLSYWRAAASFGDDWGEHGTFRVPRGRGTVNDDPLSFESEILAIYP